jgi:hypothetical protein
MYMQTHAYIQFRYVGFCVLENSEAVLVTDRHVCVHEYMGSQEKWTCEVRELADDVIDNRVVMLKTSAARYM